MTREFSAGGVVFRNTKYEVKWLVAKSAPSNLYPEGFWRLPKGWPDDEDEGERPGPLGKGEKKATESQLREAALREVEEEGGVKAKIVNKLGTERHFRGRRILKFVTFYLMEWQKDLPEGHSWETEKVLWLPYNAARKKLDHERERNVLDKANKLLVSGVQKGERRVQDSNL